MKPPPPTYATTYASSHLLVRVHPSARPPALQIQGLPTLIFVGMNKDRPALRTEGLLPATVIQVRPLPSPMGAEQLPSALGALREHGPLAWAQTLGLTPAPICPEKAGRASGAPHSAAPPPRALRPGAGAGLHRCWRVRQGPELRAQSPEVAPLCACSLGSSVQEIVENELESPAAKK